MPLAHHILHSVTPWLYSVYIFGVGKLKRQNDALILTVDMLQLIGRSLADFKEITENAKRQHTVVPANVWGASFFSSQTHFTAVATSSTMTSTMMRQHGFHQAAALGEVPQGTTKVPGTWRWGFFSLRMRRLPNG